LYNISMAKTMKQGCPIEVNVGYLRENLPRLLKDVEKGKTVVVRRYNKPIAVLSPAGQPEKPVRRFGTGKGRVRILDPHWADPMTDEEVEAFVEGRY
jgi:antitoxin (DNA-binding transcriptional repressor) of toxin-antitoxin stability system